MQRVFLLAQESGEPIDHRITAVHEMPWSWVRIAFYIKKIKNVTEQVGILCRGKPELPARWVFFDDEALEEYLELLRSRND